MRKLLFIFTLVTIVSFSQTIHAQKIKILTTEWSPYVSKHVDCHGFTAEVVCYAFLMAGHEVEFVFKSWDKNEALIKRGVNLAAFPHKKTPAREKFALFSEPVAMSRDVFFYIKKSPEKIDFESLADLKTYKIGAVKGHNYIAMLKSAGLDLDYASDTITAFKKMYIGLVDLVPENEFVGWQIIQKLYPDEMYKFASTSKSFNRDTLHLMFSIADPRSEAMRADFDHGLNEIMRTGVYRQLLKKYIKNVEIKMPSPAY